MSDIIAQLQVLSQESGCLLDLSAIVDLSICPNINIKTHKPHKVEEKDDYVCITPTETYGHKEKRCNDGKCYEVHQEVCKKNHVALDLEVLVVLGLLTEDELERYLHTCGDLPEGDKLNYKDDKDFKMDPLLSVSAGDDGSLLDADVLGPDGLLNVKLGDRQLLNLGGDGPLLNLGGKKKGLLGLGGVLKRGIDEELANVQVGGKNNHRKAAIDVDVLTHERLVRARSTPEELLDVQVGGKNNGHKAAIDVDVLTHDGPRRGGNGGYSPRPHNGGNYGNHGNNGPWTGGNRGHGNNGPEELLDLQVGGKNNGHKAVIDADVLTHDKRADKPLLDIDALGDVCDDEEATIDVDLLTNKKNCRGRGNGNNGNGNGHNGNGGGYVSQPGTSVHPDPYYLSVYQPVCGKGFKKEHRDRAEHCHAQDANHCLALCHSRGALLTLDANVKVGDIANILVCAAIEFNNSESGDNCHYYVAPETEPCQDDYLESNKDCYTFVRN